MTDRTSVLCRACSHFTAFIGMARCRKCRTEICGGCRYCRVCAAKKNVCRVCGKSLNEKGKPRYARPRFRRRHP